MHVPGFEGYGLIGTVKGNGGKASLLLETMNGDELTFVILPLESVINTDSLMTKYDKSYEHDVLKYTIDLKQFDERIEEFKPVLDKIKVNVEEGNNHVSTMGVGIMAYTLSHLALIPESFDFDFKIGWEVKAEHKGELNICHFPEELNQLPSMIIDRVLIRVFERTMEMIKC